MPAWRRLALSRFLTSQLSRGPSVNPLEGEPLPCSVASAALPLRGHARPCWGLSRLPRHRSHARVAAASRPVVAFSSSALSAADGAMGSKCGVRPFSARIAQGPMRCQGRARPCLLCGPGSAQAQLKQCDQFALVQESDKPGGRWQITLPGVEPMFTEELAHGALPRSHRRPSSVIAGQRALASCLCARSGHVRIGRASLRRRSGAPCTSCEHITHRIM